MEKRNKFYVLLLFLFVSFLISCEQQQTSETPGRFLTEAAPDEDGITKILLFYDMEGISGQNDIKSIFYGGEEYNQAREWLTNDVNAVIEGLFAGGADEVHVVDAHGSGNPDPDILLDKLDSRAELMFKDKEFHPYFDLEEMGTCDAVAVVCMHSKTGGEGFGAHTYTIGMDWILNDMSINETEIIAYSWGRIDVPVIFAAGDDKLKEQLEWMSWLEYVTVKKATSASSAELIPFDEVHGDMRAAAKRAVENIANSKAVHLTLPIKAQLRAVEPARLSALKGVPGVNYEGNTVTFEAADYKEAYDGILALMNVARRGYTRLLQQVIRGQENAREINNEFREKLILRWMDVESGRWKPPKSPEKKAPAKKYFGAR